MKTIFVSKTIQNRFWTEYPALSLGISALLGALLFFENAYLAASLWIIYCCFFSFSRALVNAVLLSGIALYSHLLFSNLPQPGPGQAIFSIHSVSPHSTPFQKGWLYQGTLVSFQSHEGRFALHIPCHVVYLGDPAARPRADCDYLLTGKLVRREGFDFTFKAKSWERSSGWSLAEIRNLSKEKIRSILNKHLSDAHTVDFLTALFTGDIENRMLRFEFGRIGLQYLLVISGFHFAILASFITFASRLILPARMRLWALLSAVFLYYLFVGNSPPVQRSFFAAALFLSGKLLGRSTSGLNILGACLIFEVALDPAIVRNVGFQLSFLSCFGIFLLHAPLTRLLHPFLSLRTLPEAVKLSVPAQCGYIVSSFFTRALILTLAVNLALAPLLLFHFHRFPILSLFYNLFAPAMTAVSLFLLLMALMLYALFPLFSLPLFKITGFVSGELLEVIANPPAVLDYGFSAHCPGWVLAPYIVFLFLIAIYYSSQRLLQPIV